MGIFGSSFLIASIFPGKQEANGQLRVRSREKLMEGGEKVWSSFGRCWESEWTRDTQKNCPAASRAHWRVVVMNLKWNQLVCVSVFQTMYSYMGAKQRRWRVEHTQGGGFIKLRGGQGRKVYMLGHDYNDWPWHLSWVRRLHSRGWRTGRWGTGTRPVKWRSKGLERWKVKLGE